MLNEISTQFIVSVCCCMIISVKIELLYATQYSRSNGTSKGLHFDSWEYFLIQKSVVAVTCVWMWNNRKWGVEMENGDFA